MIAGLRQDNFNIDVFSNTAESVLDISSTSTVPHGILVSNNGKHFYMVDYSASELIQYNMDIPFEISSANHYLTIDISSNITDPVDITSSPDGSKIFIGDRDSRKINQYNLSTPWNIGTASFNATFDLSAQISIESRVNPLFDKTGKVMYVTSSTESKIFQYTLSVPWEISTAIYANKFMSITSGYESYGSFMSIDGKHISLTGVDNILYQYDLSTPWDVSTGSLSSTFLAFLDANTVTSICSNDDFSKLYITDFGNVTINQFENLEIKEFYTIKDATYKNLFNTSAEVSALTGISWDTTGRYLYVPDYDNNDVSQYKTSIKYDVSGLVYEKATVLTSIINLYNISWNNNGTKIYASCHDITNTKKVFQYNLSTPWDVTSVIYDTEWESAETTAGIYAKPMSKDGTIMFIIGVDSLIYQYILSTPWDISTASYDSKSFSVANESSTAKDLIFSDNGEYFYIVSSDDGIIYQYTMSIPWDVSTTSYNNITLNISDKESYPTGLFIDNGSGNIYVCGTDDEIYCYEMK